MQDHYEVLGVSRTASDEVIRSTYLRLLQIYHPDHNSDASASVVTRRIVEAYKVLGTPASRAIYDDSLKPSSTTKQKPNGQQSTAPSQAPEPKPEIQIGCEFCGKLDSTLRRTTVFRVASFLFATKRVGKPIMACERCRAKQVLVHTAVAGTIGWWGFPWGPIYTTHALYYNACGGKSDATDNATILRLAGYVLYKQSRLEEAKKALSSSLQYEEHPETRSFLEQLGQSPSCKRDFLNKVSKYDLANVFCTIVVLAALFSFIYWYNARPSGYGEKYSSGNHVAQSFSTQPEPIDSKTDTRNIVNTEADQLASLVEQHATIVGHHQEGTTTITDYELDRSKFFSNEFATLADRLFAQLGDNKANEDGFVSSTYFNARIMQLSIEIVNAKHDPQAVVAGIRKLNALAQVPQVSEWLSGSQYAQPFHDLEVALDKSMFAASADKADGNSAAEDIDAMKAHILVLEKQAQEAHELGDNQGARRLALEHDRLAHIYNKLVEEHNSFLKSTRRLDLLFNKCLDPRIRMSKFQHVNLTRDDQGDIQD